SRPEGERVEGHNRGCSKSFGVGNPPRTGRLNRTNPRSVEGFDPKNRNHTKWHERTTFVFVGVISRRSFMDSYLDTSPYPITSSFSQSLVYANLCLLQKL